MMQVPGLLQLMRRRYRYDFHDYPHMVQSADGRIHLVYSKHSKALYISSVDEARTLSGSWTHRGIGKDQGDVPHAGYRVRW